MIKHFDRFKDMKLDELGSHNSCDSSSKETGDIVIAKVNGDEACCKKLIKHDEGITLQSLNTNYLPMFFSNKEIVEKPVTIIGKVIESRRKY